MVDFKRFKSCIDTIQECSDWTDKLYENKIDLLQSPIDAIVEEFADLLMNEMHDDEAWISWYCWEIDFGRTNKDDLNVVTIDGKEYRIDSVKKLWDLLHLVNGIPITDIVTILKNYLIDSDTILKAGNKYNIKEITDNYVTIYAEGREITLDRIEEGYIFTMEAEE